MRLAIACYEVVRVRDGTHAPMSVGMLLLIDTDNFFLQKLSLCSSHAGTHRHGVTQLLVSRNTSVG